jgi:hypothetical protein
MVICSRCEQQVDETKRTTCPLCFTPLPAPGAATNASQAPMRHSPQSDLDVPLAAMPSPPGGAPAPLMPQPSGIPGIYTQPSAPSTPQPSGIPGIYAQPPAPVSPLTPGARTSLSGEVYGSDGASGPPPNYMAGGVPMAPPRPGGPGAPRSSYATARPRAAAETPKSGVSPVVVVLLLLVLGGGGFGGWYYWMHRTNPKDQAEAVYRATVKQDYKALYPLIALSDEAKKQVPDADTFAQKAEQNTNQLAASNPIIKLGLDAMKNITDINVGEPTINGDKAEVPTSAKMSINGITLTFKGMAHMINQGGIWKLDETAGDMASGMQAGQDMVGKPDMSALPGGLGGKRR